MTEVATKGVTEVSHQICLDENQSNSLMFLKWKKKVKPKAGLCRLTCLSLEWTNGEA